MKVSDQENLFTIDTTSLTKVNNQFMLITTIWKLGSSHIQRKMSSLTWLVHWAFPSSWWVLVY